MLTLKSSAMRMINRSDLVARNRRLLWLLTAAGACAETFSFLPGLAQLAVPRCRIDLHANRELAKYRVRQGNEIAHQP